MPTIAIVGSTGAQGGSVINQLLKTGTWKIRALTRNTSSDSAKALASKGIEVVAADVNDEASLVKAFEGVNAVFANTAYWPDVPAHGRDGAGEIETEQLKKVARAAQQTKTLEHYVLSSLPPAAKVSGGKLKVPHFDYKQKAVDWMRENTPELYGKTSQIWPGWYPSNLLALPMVKFIEIPYAGYLWAQASKPTAHLPIAGSLEHNFGVVVEALLAAKEAAFGKHAACVTDYLPMRDVARAFEEVTGRNAAYAEVPDEVYAKLYGVYGEEYGAQLRWSEAFPDWDRVQAEDTITLEQLGVKDKLVGFRATLEGMKAQLV